MLGRRLVNNVVKNQVLTVDNSKGWKEVLQIGTTYSGESFTATEAFTSLSYVFACVTIRANAFSKLPLQLYKRTPNGSERDRDHYIAYLLEKRPNKYMTPSQLKKFWQASLMLWGNVYIRMEFDEKGRVSSLIPLEPSKVTVKKNLETGDYYYDYSSEKGIITYTEDEIIHVPYITTDGKIGKAPLSVARENVGNLKAMQRFEGTFYKNGTLTQGALVTSESLGKEEIDTLQKMWAQRYSGGENAGKIPILHSGLDFKAISIPLKDAEFVMSKRLNAVEIANIFNVPIFMLNDMEKATFNNFEQMKLLFGENCLQPDVTAGEEELNYKLFTTKEQRKYYVKFNMAAVLRGDMKTRVEAYEKLMHIAGITPNEIREKEDFNQFEMPEANVPYITRNLAPLDTIKVNAGGGGNNEEVLEPQENSE